VGKTHKRFMVYSFHEPAYLAVVGPSSFLFFRLWPSNKEHDPRLEG